MKSSLASRVLCVGTVRVTLPVERALDLFTPRGERRWAHGWDPAFPGGEADDSAPGTVFLTHDAIWKVADSTERSLPYARARPGACAATVEVRCEPEVDGTAARVTYDHPALDATERERLRDFADGYD